MTIRFTCPESGKTIAARDGLAGNTIRCPACRGTHTVPAAPAPDVTSPPGQDAPEAGRSARPGSVWRSSVIPVLVGLAIGGASVYLKIKVRQADEVERQQQEAAAARLHDEYIRQQARKSGVSDREREMMRALPAAMLFRDKVQADDLPAAYQMTTPAFQARVSQASFEELVRKYPDVRTPDHCIVSVTMSYRSGPARVFQLGKVADPNRDTPVVSITVVKQGEEGVWAVNDFTIRPRGDE